MKGEMRPAQCPFAKEVFSEDETIFLVRSPKDKYDVDSVDMGLCLREVQHAQARTGSQCAASDMNCVPDPRGTQSGLDIWFLTWA